MSFVEIELKDIIVEERQRRDYGDLSELAKSIQKYGQLQNLVVSPVEDGKFRLVAGGRRLAGLAAAGKTSAFATLRADADELLLQELELEENVQRKDLSWQEKQDAISRIHEIKSKSAKAEGLDWNAEQTAKLLGMAKRSVYNAIELSAAVKEDPEIAKADTAFGAMQRLARKKDLKNRIEAVEVRTLAQELGTVKPYDIKVVQGDALVRMKEVADESCDFVVTNPPYGVNIEEIFTADKKIYGDDTPEHMGELCRNVFKEAYRVLKPDRWFVTFYPTRRLEECRDFLAEAGFNFQAVPAIWVKPNKYMSSVNDPYAQLAIKYESFFFARKGKAKFHDLRKDGDVFIYDTPSSKRIHPLQMPPELWEEIFRMITIRGEVGVEPFAGSGSAGIAAIKRDLDYTGFELDPEYVARGNMWIQETIAGVDPVKAISIESDEEVPF